MSTQLIGFSLGGICKRILVEPASMIWPANLALAALFNTLHAQGKRDTQGWRGISRDRFFTYVSIGYFFYSQLSSPFSILTLLIFHFILDFLPSYLFTALSSFSWVCWIIPNHVKVNQIFGVTHGLSMGLLTFDWGQIIAFIDSPLIVPWWAAANIGIAVVFFYWFLVPILSVSLISFISFFISEHTHTVFQRLVQCLPTRSIPTVLR